jgi:dTMP kinase
MAHKSGQTGVSVLHSLRQMRGHVRLATQTMTPRGKLIALEGIDGSGKGTQLDLLARALKTRGFAVLRISFPRYGSFFGNLAAGFLNGDFGAAGQVDPRLSSLVYAGDRWEAKPEMESGLASGKIVLADRYVASNLAHQSERVPPE